jgi:peptidoglycan/xylan/chitin deacetylase (PgdA/CDA1 family)
MGFGPIRGLVVSLVLAVLAMAQPAVAASAPNPALIGSGAVVFVYGRVGDDRGPGPSIRIDQFEDHLDELRDGDYHLVPLPGVVDILRKGGSLPDRTVVITVDDSTDSAYHEAYPRLHAAGVPFTLFVATDALDRALSGSLTWDQVREMARNGVTIGAITASGLPMASRPADELRDDLERMKTRFRAELGTVPTIFAYPHGEYSLPVRQMVIDAGFAAAFGQQSGVAYPGADPYALPRFVMNDAFGSLDRFQLAANALPLPVGDVTPADPVLTRNPPILGFTVPDGIGNLDRLACFATGQGRTKVERLGSNRIEVRITESLPPGRTRVNCTLPAEDDRWRWFGVQFFVPGE